MTTRTTCDHCGKELPEADRFTLQQDHSAGGRNRPTRDLWHFCWWTCLHAWLSAHAEKNGWNR